MAAADGCARGTEWAEKHPVREARIIARSLDGETVLLDPDSGAIHTLNASADLIWQSCDGSRSCETIADALRKEFGIDSTQSREDTRGCVRDLEARDLIRVGSRGTTVVE